MKTIIFATLMLFALAQSCYADVIHFIPGPYGGSKIITPWGDYIAYQTGGMIVVSTEKDYMNAMADTVSQEKGFKHVIIEGESKNVRNYVDTKYNSTSLGNNNLYEISTRIVFGVPPSKQPIRPKKNDSEEYVQIVWTPTKHEKVNLTLGIYGNEKTFEPNYCKNDWPFSICEFTINREFLTKPILYAFYVKKLKPAAIQVDSIAKQMFKDVELSWRDSKGIDMDDDQKNDIRLLHSLDESIPAEISRN